MEEGAAAAMQFIQENPGATAIQAVNDLVAIGAADALLNQGVRIPQDLSVAGFGNVLVSEFFRVPSRRCDNRNCDWVPWRWS